MGSEEAILYLKSPAASVVQENAATLLCSETPEMFCGIRNFTQLSIGMG